MEYVFHIRRCGGHSHGKTPEKLAIARSRLAPGGIILRQVRKFDPQDRRLQGIEAAVEAENFVVVTDPRPVRRDHTHRIGKSGVVGHNHAAVPEAPQVLAREETYAADGPYRADLAPPVRRAHRLRRVFDYRDTVSASDSHYGVHVGGVAIQVDRDDRLRMRGHGIPDERGVDVHCHGIDIHVDGFRPEDPDRLSRGDKRERCRDDFVPGAYPERHHGDLQRVGPRRTPDRVLHAEISGYFALELSHLFSLDEHPRVEHRVYCRIDITLDIPILTDNIHHLKFHGAFPVRRGTCEACARPYRPRPRSIWYAVLSMILKSIRSDIFSI